jgi:Na+/H+-dicarboxylate symporter
MSKRRIAPSARCVSLRQSCAIILGIDRFLDMCRTTLNVTGDLVCAVVAARGEQQPTT